MLPEDHHQHLQAFQKVLVQLEQMITQPEFDRVTFQTEVTDIQKLFQAEIRPLNLDELSATEAHRVQSVFVEIDKQLRLLGMDAMFLQTAKQANTLKQRLAQIRDRLKILIGYCQVLLQAAN